MKTNHQKALIASVLIALTCCAVPALADDDAVYNNSLRAGLYSIFYHTSSDDLSGPYVPAGVGFKALNLETLYLGYVRTVVPHFEIELAAGYPPLSKVQGQGPATLGSVPYNGQVISSARWISPTLLFEYSFLEPTAKLRPYIGVGVNYTTFYDRINTAQGNAASGGPTKLSLTPSVGPAATVGLQYAVTSRWHLYASYSASRVNTTIDAYTAGFERTTRIHFGPQALVVSGGYSF
jgi:outer membrane protein